jgi:2-polyprenyl-3-methyl-5-hydroxy-6-metoxy-1,4-benzoquinol methylase
MKYFAYERAEMVPFLPPGCEKALEIGCAEGVFRGHLPAQCEYWGVEMNPEAADKAGKVLDKVLTGTYQEVSPQLPGGYFDIVICNDVIEHMADHAAFLQALKANLKPGGVLIGSVPNVRFQKNLVELLLQKDWEYKDEGILDRTHLRFFTEKSLRRSLEENGFVIESLEGINSLLKRKVTPRSLLRWLLVTLLGTDTQYRQFGFRASAGQ